MIVVTEFHAQLDHEDAVGEQYYTVFVPGGKHLPPNLLKLTGISLETYTPSYYGDVNSGYANHIGMVKEISIGQSAAKILKYLQLKNKVQRLNGKALCKN